MNNERIIKKIKALFALAADKGATGNESENAMRMAQKLLQKHGLEKGDLAEGQKVTIILSTMPMSPWIEMVFQGVTKLYDCKCITTSRFGDKKYVIIGTESNTTTADIVIKQLIDQIYRDCKNKGNAFRNGAAESLYSLCMQLWKERQKSTDEVAPGTGLIPMDISKQRIQDIDEWISENMNVKNTKARRYSTSQSGREYGKTLNPGARVKGSKQRCLN